MLRRVGTIFAAVDPYVRLTGRSHLGAEVILDEMREIVASAGYTPAVKIGDTIYVIGQVGRTKDLQ